MSWLWQVRERLDALVSGNRLDAEADEELRFHLDMETEKNIRKGMDPAQARRQAMIAFGGVERFREETRDERGARPLEDLVRDLRLAVRTLRKAPGMVVVTVLSLGLGIAASATVFSLADAMVLGGDAGPIAEPERVVAVYTSDEDGNRYGESSFPDYEEIRDGARTLDHLAAHRVGVVTVGDPEHRDRVIVELVTGEYFRVLGITPALGRTFSPEETVPGSAGRLMVLSHRAWQERFGSDRNVLGQVMELDEQPYTIIGVAPEGLAGRYMKMDVEGWVPLGVAGGIYRVSPPSLKDRDSRQFFMLGRLAPGRTADEAQAEMRVLSARFHDDHSASWEDARGEPKALTVVSEAESRTPPHIRTALLGTAAVLVAGGLLVLLLACSNVASLLLARAHKRSWEMAVRVSLGAGRGRLFRMLLAESLLLSVLGGALGLLLTHLAIGSFRAVPLPMDVPLRFDIRLDGSVLLFTLALSLGASFLAGIGPALRGSRTNLTPILKGDSVRGGAERRRITLRSVLVVGQVAAATLFVVGAGLALRSVQASTTYDLGLDAEGVAVAWAEPPEENLPPAELRVHFLALADRLRSQPEVETVALSRTAEAHPLMEDFATSLVELGEEEPLRVHFNAVTPGYFQMLNIPLARGREILDTDVEGGPAVAVVNRAFAERFFPGRDGLGEVFRVSAWFDGERREDRPGTTFEVVGIVPAPSRSGGNPPGPFFWSSFLQDPPVRAIVHARGVGDAEALVPVLRREVTSSSVAFTPVEPGSYADYIDYRFLGHKIVSAVLSFAGLFALVLAFIGVFGIVSFAVTLRYREMAIRRAMGARKGQVITTLLRRDLMGTAVGILLGLALAVPLAFLARAGLLGVQPLDPAAVGGGTGLLVLASLLAGVIPTRHLLRAEPMDVLREE